MKSLLGTLLVIGFSLLAGVNLFAASGTQPATKPAATQNAETWTVAVPQSPYVISVARPRGWKEKTHSSGQPFLYKPGIGNDEIEAWWEFDIKYGLNGRTIEEIATQLATSTAKRSDTTVVKKEVVDRPDGTKAGILISKIKVAGAPEMTIREYFIILDKDALLAVAEHTSSSASDKQSPALAKITDSIKVERK